MVAYIFNKIAPFLCGFLLLTTVAFFLVGVYRGEQVVALQNKLLTAKEQEVKVIIQQHESAAKISEAYEERKADREQDKIYVTREVEKIVTVPSYSNLCFDDVGVSFYNDQIRALNSARQSKDSVSANTGAE